jgi:hypothetical protein
MHRLQNFVTTELVPELDALERAYVEQEFDEVAMLQSFLAEKFLWLHLGTEIGAFPPPDAAAVFDSYLAPFFRQNPPGGEGFFLSQGVRLSFTPFAHYLFERALFFSNLPLKAVGDEEIKKEIFGAQQVIFEEPKTLTGLFQTHLLLRGHVWRNPAVRWFIRALNFSTQEFWNSIWDQDCSPEQVIDAYSETDPKPKKALMYAGFLGMFRYGAQVRQLGESIPDDRILAHYDVLKLLSRIREIQGWTINLRSGEVSQRFESVRQGLSQALQSQSYVDENVTEEIVVEIEKSVNDALEFIGVPQLVYA